MYISILKCIFALLALVTLICSLLINYLEPLLPTFFIQSFRYGKFSYKIRHSFVFNYLEVPKKWFRHFYIVAAMCSTFILILAVNCYYFGTPVPSIVTLYLDFVSTSDRKVGVSATSTFLALVLFNAQCWRRLYETFFISVFSDTRINIIHYVVGIVHYVGTVSAIISESPVFASATFEYRNILSFSDITWRNIIGTIIFVWAWYHQYISAIILGNLRKDKTGKVLTYDHKVPTGDLFNGISSPHLFCEMIMYLSLNIILWGNSTLPYVFCWVVTNQCESALLSHWWYKSKFDSYPKNRRAFIPYLL